MLHHEPTTFPHLLHRHIKIHLPGKNIRAQLTCFSLINCILRMQSRSIAVLSADEFELQLKPTLQNSIAVVEVNRIRIFPVVGSIIVIIRFSFFSLLKLDPSIFKVHLTLLVLLLPTS